MNLTNSLYSLSTEGATAFFNNRAVPDNAATSAEFTLSEHGRILLSVQCYAWTGYSFTCVCVCVCLFVCVSVTLSINSPTGQTPQRIFIVDSLTDVDLCKDVAFGGLDDE